MTYDKHGKNISSNIEIQSTSFGIWVLVFDSEYFLPYKHYPWFQNAKISDVHQVELHHKSHLYWPTLDVDLDIDCLRYPEKYPLVAAVTAVSTAIAAPTAKMSTTSPPFTAVKKAAPFATADLTAGTDSKKPKDKKKQKTGDKRPPPAI